jgi:putative hydrolase of the HAD superfamily
LADAYNALHDEELSMFPDAHETLDRLKELGIKLVLITNGAAEPQRAKVVRFDLEQRFDHIQIEGEHGFGKPEERAYKHAMEKLGVGPHETWMVCDDLEWASYPRSRPCSMDGVGREERQDGVVKYKTVSPSSAKTSRSQPAPGSPGGVGLEDGCYLARALHGRFF